MLFAGIFWGIVCILMIVGSNMIFLVRKFYNMAISGLSRGKHRKIIESTIYWANTLEECHTTFGIAAFIAVLFHGIIMKFFVGNSILGVITLILFIFIFVTGIIEKYIYRDSIRNTKKYHLVINVLFIVFLLFHIFLK